MRNVFFHKSCKKIELVSISHETMAEIRGENPEVQHVRGKGPSPLQSDVSGELPEKTSVFQYSIQ